jgi:hypothetical protein
MWPRSRGLSIHSIRPVHAEPAAQRSRFRRDPAGRRSQGGRQPDGDRARCFFDTIRWAELAKQLANLRRKRPRSETLERLERQLTLPLEGIVARAALRRKDEHETKPKNRRRRHPGRAAFAAKLERVEVPNPVPHAQRRCPICGKEMKLVAHSRCETGSATELNVSFQ